MLLECRDSQGLLEILEWMERMDWLDNLVLEENLVLQVYQEL